MYGLAKIKIGCCPLGAGPKTYGKTAELLCILGTTPPDLVSTALQFGPTALLSHLLSFMFFAPMARGSSDLHYQFLEHNTLTAKLRSASPSPLPLDNKLSGCIFMR